MTPTQQTAMRVAIDAFHTTNIERHVDAIGALRAALAEPAVEPVAHINSNGVVHAAGYPWGSGEILTPLYTSPPPPAKVPLLTDGDIGMQMAIAWGHTSIAPRQAPTFARAIEQAVRQKVGIK